MRGLFVLEDKKRVIYHIAGWVTFIVYEVSFVKLIRWSSADTSIWSGYIIPYFINISLFYFHAFVTMPIGFAKTYKKSILFIILIPLELSVYLLLMGIKDLDFLNSNFGFISSLYPTKIDFIKQLWRGIYFLIFGTAFWLIHKSFKKEKMLKEAEKKALLRQQEKKELELKLISSQNAFLQSQINPHLLFNTLNFIHSEIQQVSTKASDAIIILSDMMRYSLTETKTDGKVPLEKEIEQIDNLIKINQFRFNNRLCINLTTQGGFNSSRIIPLLLIPVVENLFKYAELMDEVNPVQIHIKLEGNLLYFETFNKKKKTINFYSPGIGIENVKTRLNTYYFNHFYLDIHDSQSGFSVKLRIEL